MADIPESTKMLPVTQADVTDIDRAAVTAFHSIQIKRIIAGDKTLGDNRDVIEQAFARHRIEAEQRAISAAPPAMDREALIRTLKSAGGLHNPEENAPFIADAILSTLSADAIRQGEGISIPDDLREAARYASDGPWEIDSERNEDGAYGSGPDHGTGYDDYIILDAEGRTLFGSENSTAKLIEEEYSEDDVYVWDQVGKRNAAFIVAAVNFVRKMLATPASHASDGGKA